MSSRHVSSGWRYGLSVLAVLLFPLVAVHTLMIGAVALFMMVAGTFALVDGGTVLIGIAIGVLTLLMLGLCWWMFQQRRALLRTHRAVLGGVLLAAALLTWALAPAEPMHRKAVVSVAALYGLFGIGLAIHAWEDKWGA